MTSVFDEVRTRLTDILWKETSGVDHPANLEEGWAVMKNKGGTLDDLDLDRLSELLDEADRVTKGADLAAALGGADFSKAPKDVQAAAKILHGFAGEQAKAEQQDKEGTSLTRRVLGFLLDKLDADKEASAEQAEEKKLAQRLAQKATFDPDADDADAALAAAVASAIPALMADIRVAKAAGDSHVRETIGIGAIARFEATVKAKLQEGK